MRLRHLRTALVLAIAALAMQAAATRARAADELQLPAEAAPAPIIGTGIKRANGGAADGPIDFGGGARAAKRVPGIVGDGGSGGMRAPSRADAASVAEGRDTEGMVRLALDYWRGANGPKNVHESQRMFEAAAARGDVRGRIASAWMLAEGLGVPRDTQRGKEQLDQLARQGHARAAYLRILVEEAHPEGRDRQERRMQRLQEAAALGDALAQNLLGIEFEKLGQTGTARLWYAEAARGGSRAAADNIDRMDAKVARKRAKPPVRVLAVEAERGDRVASFELAQRYHRGDGVSVNYAEAVRWYQAAAAREYGPARQMLALIYSDPSAAQQGFDSAWMRRLAQVTLAPDGTGARLENVADGLPVRDADPLAALESVKR
jgi:TPR repeat protein